MRIEIIQAVIQGRVVSLRQSKLSLKACPNIDVDFPYNNSKCMDKGITDRSYIKKIVANRTPHR